jgi:hypothetical protein
MNGDRTVWWFIVKYGLPWSPWWCFWEGPLAHYGYGGNQKAKGDRRLFDKAGRQLLLPYASTSQASPGRVPRYPSEGTSPQN